MQFCDHIYFGKKAKKAQDQILRGLKEHKLQPDVYVITFPLSGNHLYDIYPSAELLLPGFQEELRMVAGIAVTYWEALEVVRDIVDDRQRQGAL